MSAPVRPIRSDRLESDFDLALASAARSLVVEPLPGGVLTAATPLPGRARARSGAPVAAAVAVLVLVIGAAIGAPRAPVMESASAFRTGAGLSVALRSTGFSCHPGTTALPGQARMEAIVCTATTPTVIATAIVSEDPAGQVGEIHVQADILGTGSTADSDRASLLLATIGLPFADPMDAAAARGWLTTELPLDLGDRVRTTIDSVPVVLERGVSGYSIVLGDLGVGSPAVPTR